MRYGIHIQNWGDYADPAVLVDLAREAESSGWDGVFLWDHILWRRTGVVPVVDPWVALAAIATVTSRIRLGALVTPLARRRPWKVARETASIDHLSGGRLIFGAGIGEPVEDDFATFGEEGDAKIRAGRLDEGLDILAGLWRGEPFEHRGRHFQVERATFLPPPVQRPRIPVWIGGEWPNKAPFRRAARWDGVFPGKRGVAINETMTPADLREIVVFVAANRDPDLALPFDIVLGGYTSARDRAHATETVAAYAEVGLTWWLEGLNDFARTSVDARERVRSGPPIG